MRLPDLGNLPAWVALLVAGIGGWVTYRRQRVDERGGDIDRIQKVLGTVEKELERVNTQLETSRADCQKQIDTLQMQLTDARETVLRLSNQITSLERRRASQVTEQERRGGKDT